MSTRPGPWLRLRYLLGATLPDSYRDWVARDVAGPGGLRRYAIRGCVPMLPLFAVLVLVPGPVWIRIGMVLLLLLPWIYFLFALNEVYRSHRLRSHGFNPEILYRAARERDAAARHEYGSRFRDYQ